jgi:peroxiredoxin
VNVGDTAPDLAFVTTRGRAVRLSDFRGEAMVLVFMRHLG